MTLLLVCRRPSKEKCPSREQLIKGHPLKKHQPNIHFSQNIVFMNILIIIFLLAGAENGT